MAEEEECGFAHISGGVVTGIALIGLIAGFVMIIAFEEGVTGYWVGVVCLSIGVVCSLLVLVYVCIAFKRKQALYGCVRVIPDTPLKLPGPPLPPVAGNTPRPSELPSMGHFEGRSVHRENSAYTENSGTKGVEWDPDTVLGDD